MQGQFRIPFSVWLIAALVALIHIVPFWRAQHEAPQGYRFTGVLYASPDFIPYRVWIRQTQEMGILVDNRFTSEPNRPHLLLVFYYAIGKLSEWTQVTPEYALAYTGCFLAFALAIVLFLLIRGFFVSTYQTMWVFLATLFGGGLTTHLKILSLLPFRRLQHLLSVPITNARLLEENRGGYIVGILFDTHFLVVWLLASLSLLAYRKTLSRFSLLNIAFTGLLFGFSTIVHVYEGITLLMIVAGILLISWIKRISLMPVFILTAVCFIATAIAFLIQVLLYRRSGLPISPWSEPPVIFSTLILSFPLAWILIVRGWSTFWSRTSLNECFVAGWALGCLTLTLSGPFYPYPERGMVTLQIALSIMAGMMYFKWHRRVSAKHAVVAVLLLSATPLWFFAQQWKLSSFRVDPHVFEDQEHREMINFLIETASSTDVLLSDKSMPGWLSDDLWLYPEYPGKFYCGHFFLTVRFEKKRFWANEFFINKNPKEQEAFLRENHIRFVFVGNTKDPEPLMSIPGVVLLKRNSAGSILEYKGLDL
jgi:hypothetical protein